MARLPFNPDRIPSPSAPASGKTASGKESGKAPADRPLTVSQIAVVIKDALLNSIPGKVRVIGEISNFSERAHWFFSLKDEAAALRCVCFASAARKINFPVSDGMEVVATGRIDFYDAQGNIQLYVENLEPVGQGALELKFKALCEELRRLGYFDDSRKKRLPSMPQRVAVVTSRSGAALQDVINTAQRRWEGCQLLLMDVRVQGGAAAPEIAAAIQQLSRHGAKLGIDAIILTRGGGSIEDLWAFNERVVADAIFKCSLPIVAAIGHEVDVTIAELVADVRCSTPTQAAMTLIPDKRTLQQQVRQLSQRLGLVLRRQADRSRQRLEVLVRNPIFRRPERMLDPARQDLATLAAQLQATLPRTLKAQSDRLALLTRHLQAALPRRMKTGGDKLTALARQLQAVGPLNVLERGYSYTLGPQGQVLRSPSQVAPGEQITSVLAQGRVASQVVGSSNEGLRAKSPVKKHKPPIRRQGPTLFGEES